MTTTEKTPAEKPDGASKRQPANTTGNASARTFRDTWQHMVDRLPQDSTKEAASETAEKTTPGTSDDAAENAASDTVNSTPEDTASDTPDDTPKNTVSHTSGITPESAVSHTPDITPESAVSESSDTPIETTDTASVRRFRMPSKRALQYTAAGAAAILLFTYLGVSFFFQKHYLVHTTINGQDFSCQTKEEARAFFAEQAEDYTLEIVESGKKTEKVTGKEISMTWDDNLKLDYIMDKQNAFAWPLEYFKEKSEDVLFRVSCDESALSKTVDKLHAVVDEPTPAQSAYPKFDGNAFIIEPEVYGTAVDSEKLKEKILESALNLEETLNLQEEGFYEKPQYTTESPEMIEVCKNLNDLCRASITYEMDVPVVVDKTLISTWLSVDDQFHVILDENAVRNWVLEFDARYDTLGGTRTLTTPAGKAAEVSGGTYGWSINEDEEFAALLNSIRNGEVLTRTPAYAQTAASHAPQDWGSTFLEVDLTTQHMWYVRDSAVVFESDVVTGSPPNGTTTPPGVYTILEKLSPTVLVGNINPATGKPEYRTPVTFWMRVTYSGIGFHDATWQPAFGGDVYMWNGSHGCINMPFYGAQELYSLIEIGLPVVIHY